MTAGHSERQQLSKEKESLSETTESLKQALKEVEEKMEKLNHERMEAEDRLVAIIIINRTKGGKREDRETKP